MYCYDNFLSLLSRSLLIEKGICLIGNVCILSKLVILLNHKGILIRKSY